MDPDGSILFIINFIISVIVCLYIAETRVDEDYDDYEIGVSPSLISAGTLFLLNFGVLSFFALPKFELLWQCILGTLFVLFGVVTPYCIGIAEHDKMSFVEKILKPIIMVLNYSLTYIISLPVIAIFKIFKLKTESKVTQEDVMELVEDASDELIDDERKEMIENIFELDDIAVSEIMKHRTDVLAVNENDSCAKAIEKMQEKGFSRIPIYSGTIDTVTGLLYAKDLLSVAGDKAKMEMPVKAFARKAMFIPKTCSANELLLQFKIKRMQMAIVIDEYGGTSGIITMEDILEEIVGNIQDEYDNEDEEYQKIDDNTYIFKASLNIYDAMELFDIDIEEDEEEEEDFDTVGGMIIDILARIPEENENAVVEYKGVKFTVLSVADRRIVSVKAEKEIEEIEEC